MYLKNNSFKTLPESLGKLINLKKLDLDDHKSLEGLPDSIGDLRLLENLYLDSCALKKLPNLLGSPL